MGRRTPSRLNCFSVFGNMRLDANGDMVPFTAADCPGGTAIFPQSSPAVNGMWDVFRPTVDTTGYIRRLLAQMPRANFFGALDGLNLAQYAYLQKEAAAPAAPRNRSPIRTPTASRSISKSITTSTRTTRPPSITPISGTTATATFPPGRTDRRDRRPGGLTSLPPTSLRR